MQRVELNGFEEFLVAAGFVCVLVSYAFRLRLFAKFGEDPVVKEATFGSFATSFYDLLSLKLFRARRELLKESRSTVYGFSGFHFLSAALIAASLFSYAIRSFL